MKLTVVSLAFALPLAAFADPNQGEASPQNPGHPRQIIFQEGLDVTINGAPTGVIYNGGADAEIQSNNPGVNFDLGSGGTPPDHQLVVSTTSHVLLRFDDIFGSGPGRIPPGSTINNAFLELSVDVVGSPFTLWNLGIPFDPATVTWASFGDGVTGVNSVLSPMGRVAERILEFDATNTLPGFNTRIDVTPSVIAWANGSVPNRGWGFRDSGGNEFDSSHNTGDPPFDRPALVVDFTPPPPTLNFETPIPGAVPGVRVTLNGLPDVDYTLFDSIDLDNFGFVANLSDPSGTSIFDDIGPTLVKRFFNAIETPSFHTLFGLPDQLNLTSRTMPPNAIVMFDLDGDTFFETTALADANGVLTLPIDLTGLPSPFQILYQITDPATGAIYPINSFDAHHFGAPIPACAVPLNLVPAPSGPGDCMDDPVICACTDCCPEPFAAYTHSFTPTVEDVTLCNGRVRKEFPITSSKGRLLDFNLSLHHATRTQYDGPYGCSMSHSYNLMIVRDTPNDGRLITPDLRVYPINSPNGTDWNLPPGFNSTLTLDPLLHRWKLAHFSGPVIDFYLANDGKPGLPISVSEPNGNAMNFFYSPSGELSAVETSLGQFQRFSYSPFDNRLEAFSNHLGHTWTFAYDPNGNLIQINTPEVEVTQAAPGQLVDDNLLNVTKQSRTTSLFYSDPAHPWQLTQVVDPRGATTCQFLYDGQGRCEQQFINPASSPNPVQYIYDAHSSPPPGPPVQPVLEPLNHVTRVIDRKGHIIDHEIHPFDGNPNQGNQGKGGLRRKITWTETGKGGTPLRPFEPDFYEQRFLHDCDCLRPVVVTEEFSSDDLGSIVFDPDQIPFNWPRHVYRYNQFRQVLAHNFTDGIGMILTTRNYQADAFGTNGQFSRCINRVNPRQFAFSAVDAGGSFVHGYQHDNRGNCIGHTGPTVTKGQPGPQAILETWTYNEFGQLTRHTDPENNVTDYEYYDDANPCCGGDSNTRGSFRGYLCSITRGATGSSDAAQNLTTVFRVNALGNVTLRVDPNGAAYRYSHNNVGELVAESTPFVTTTSGSSQYLTEYRYDAAGNCVLHSRTNVDEAGSSIPGNAFVDRAYAYDDVGNLVAKSCEIDGTGANDLVTRYAYDANDQLAVTVKPEGNRTFCTYDERNLPLRCFDGVDPGASPLADFPADPDTTLVIPWITDLRYDYDGRGNRTLLQDGRGFETHYVYDSFNRLTATSDPNGNGTTYAYDAANNILRKSRGVVDVSGALVVNSETTYCRFDAINRLYLESKDLDTVTDESAAPVPDAGGFNPTRFNVFDAATRIRVSTDANGNDTTFTYDSANRVSLTTDALGNTIGYTYDGNGNILNRTETEVPGPGVTGLPASETFVHSYTYDEINRCKTSTDKGNTLSPIAHLITWRYDSKGNRTTSTDPEGQVSRYSFDDANRLVGVNVESPGSGLLEVVEYTYDRNSNKISETSFTDVTNLGTSGQTTTYTYDVFDRLERITYPDSTGATDDVEYTYDANDNVVEILDQRGVRRDRTFDAANRLVVEDLVFTGPVLPGVTRCEYDYDELNRVFAHRNDHAETFLVYDSLSRATLENQKLRLDGTGFTNGYLYSQFTIREFDAYDNITRLQVEEHPAGITELDTAYTYDGLNRVQKVESDYLGTGNHTIATYDYYGNRVVGKTLGNGVVLTNTFDSKRRVSSMVYFSGTATAVANEYAYDDVDNLVRVAMPHDGGTYDHHAYNDRYEVTGTEYRTASALPPGTFNSLWTYDDGGNRLGATVVQPYVAGTAITDSYTANTANEYTALTRSGTSLAPPSYDAAGNMTGLPVVQPSTGIDFDAAVRYDAFNRAHDVTIAGQPVENYRYDALGRRIASFTESGTITGRRYIYDEFRVLSERLFDAAATAADPLSTLDRIYIDGIRIDEHLLVAVDGDQDGTLVGNPNGINVTTPGADLHYYPLADSRDSSLALSDAGDPNTVLEYYRYTAYGEVTAVPGLGDIADLDLSNNFSAGSFRSSQFSNPYLFTGRRFDDATGLYNYRSRYYEPRTGRFLSRDPIGYDGGMNLYAYTANNPLSFVDPKGHRPTPPRVGIDGWEVETPDSHYIQRRLRADWEAYKREHRAWSDSCNPFAKEPKAYYDYRLEIDNEYLSQVGNLIERGVTMSMYRNDRNGDGSTRWTVAQNQEDVNKFAPVIVREHGYRGSPQEEIDANLARLQAQTRRDYNITSKIVVKNHRIRGRTGVCSWSDEIIADYEITLTVTDARTGKTILTTKSESTGENSAYDAGMKAGQQLVNRLNSGGR